MPAINLVRSTCFLLLVAATFTGRANILYPSMTEAVAFANADVLALAKVLAIAPLVERGETQSWASVISIEIQTQGVSAKTNAMVFWNQRLADAIQIPKRAPEVGRIYRVYLRLQDANTKSDFEPVHPDWGFVEPDNTDSQTRSTFIEHSVLRGDTLWSIAAHYYGTGSRWRVLRAANFTNDAALGAYPLKSGTKLRIPLFPMKKSPQQSKITEPGDGAPPSFRTSRAPGR